MKNLLSVMIEILSGAREIVHCSRIHLVWYMREDLSMHGDIYVQ